MVPQGHKFFATLSLGRLRSRGVSTGHDFQDPCL